MKIAIVSSGNSVHVKKIVNYLISINYNVTLYTLKNHNKLLNSFDEKVKIVKLPFSGKLGYYLNAPVLKRYILNGDFDLINSHYASGYGTLVRMAKIHPLCLAIFGSDVYDYPYKSKLNMKLILKNLNNADVITSTSNVMEEKVREYYKTSEKIYITPFGVDLKMFHPTRKVKNDGDNIFKFGIIKKIEAKYGIDILIKSFKKFCDLEPEANVNLIIYGRGSILDDMKLLSKNLEIDHLVKFMGFIENSLVPGALNNLDVACFPSLLESESFGVAAVEAMACGVPVITSDASGFTEVVVDKVTGIIVEKNNVDKLANALVEMYNMSYKERKKLGDAAAKRVRSYYNFDENMKEYLIALDNTVKNYDN